MHFAATVYLQKSIKSSINNSQRYTRIKETHLGLNERFSKYDYHLNEYIGDLVISRSNRILWGTKTYNSQLCTYNVGANCVHRNKLRWPVDQQVRSAVYVLNTWERDSVSSANANVSVSITQRNYTYMYIAGLATRWVHVTQRSCWTMGPTD